jgi:hypothetical protein
MYEMEQGISPRGNPRNGKSAKNKQKWPMQLGAGGLSNTIVVCCGIGGSTLRMKTGA